MEKIIKAIIFDADDTILDHKVCEKQALQYLFNKIEEEYKNEYQDVFRPLDNKLWNDAMNGESKYPIDKLAEYRFEIFFKKINVKYNNYKLANELFKEGFASTSSLTKNSYEIIKYLHDKKYKIYVITNGIVELQKPRIINSLIGSYISDIIVSEEVGIAKPDSKIFNILLEKINLKSNEVIMIGDNLEKDIKGAQNANIISIWYNPDNKNNNTKILPNYEIKDLMEIQQLLKNNKND